MQLSVIDSDLQRAKTERDRKLAEVERDQNKIIQTKRAELEAALATAVTTNTQTHREVDSYKIDKLAAGEAAKSAAKSQAVELKGQLDAPVHVATRAEIDAFRNQPVERVMQRLGERLQGCDDRHPTVPPGRLAAARATRERRRCEVNNLVKASKIVVIAAFVLWIIPTVFTAGVGPHEIGVRQSATSGVLDEDLGPGWHLRIPGMHKLIRLPSNYFMLDFTSDEVGPQKPLVIRTKDNNTVDLEVSVPVRIKPGEAHALVQAGNHVQDPDGRFRYMRLAEETATSVLREQMAALDSVGFYSTDRRLEASAAALKALNKQLAPMHVEAQAVLVRAVRFRDDYEKQLQQIQLNEQNKLLDAASQKLATVQQSFSTTSSRARTRRSPAAPAGVGQQAEQARSARIRVEAARCGRGDAGCGTRQAGNPRRDGSSRAPHRSGDHVRDGSRFGQRRLSDRHQEHPGRDARVQEPAHGASRRARGSPRRRG